MAYRIFLAVILGVGVGYFFLPSSFGGSIETLIDLGLMVLLFFVGIDIGKQKDIFSKIKKMGLKMLLVPFAIILGGLVGGIVGGFFLKIPLNEAGAVGSGLGWYTLSSTMLLADGYIELSALAFLTNVFREVIALVTIPLIAVHIGKLEALSMGGAATMDTTLPVIAAATDPETVIIAFVSGVICTTSVPIILPIILNMKF